MLGSGGSGKEISTCTVGRQFGHGAQDYVFIPGIGLGIIDYFVFSACLVVVVNAAWLGF